MAFHNDFSDDLHLDNTFQEYSFESGLLQSEQVSAQDPDTWFFSELLEDKNLNTEENRRILRAAMRRIPSLARKPSFNRFANDSYDYENITLFDAMGADESSIEYVEDRKGHDLRYSVDWTKINRELGYEPQVVFEDGLRETIQWYRDNEAWWKPLKNR